MERLSLEAKALLLMSLQYKELPQRIRRRREFVRKLENTILRANQEKNTQAPKSYVETEIWDLDELLLIVKHEPNVRNKVALMLFWDLDARNHEVTRLKIKHVRLGENYGEGEIPYDTKTGACF